MDTNLDLETCTAIVNFIRTEAFIMENRQSDYRSKVKKDQCKEKAHFARYLANAIESGNL